MKRNSILFLLAVTFALLSCGSKSNTANEDETTDSTAVANVSEVYFIRDINAENLVKIYEALNRSAEGRVAVKISTGEPGGHHYLDPNLIKNLVQMVNGTIVECNTAYPGKRMNTADHLQAAKDHGFTAIANVDIMDAEGEMQIPVEGGKHLQYDIVGNHLQNYDFMVVLSHFKGHAMGGFGGALKNISIGVASTAGKSWIHSAGTTVNPDEMWANLPEQDDFTESMAEAAKAVADHFGDKILYISVLNNLSVDCDCDANPAEPKMADIGIMASLDPVALDQACVDMIFNSDDEGRADLIERINSRKGTHILDHAATIGVGSKTYKVIELK
ncbi:MAG: DUF362 domain-containing protein [Bacteroidales bacterium]|nr:DUF362 domain-containing protein [Bacteroidales bacterium]